LERETMQILRRVEETRSFSRSSKREGRSLALVPTMGYLHEGHLSLIRTARRTASSVMVSLFVNPTQFAPGEDLDRYPRDFERDSALCRQEGVDALFAPESTEIYPDGFSTKVSIQGPLTEGLCGARRPGHFDGVATVVAKLFAICEPDLAVFGQKDAQQVAVVRRMVQDLNLPVQIVVEPIVREGDGVAMSSRNVYLTPEERAQAPILHRALETAQRLALAGESNPSAILHEVTRVLGSSPLARLDYAEIVDPETMAPVQTLSGDALLAMAVFFGSTRLIDNAVLKQTAKQ
jgi:pantoate--beta-alanine ligase